MPQACFVFTNRQTSTHTHRHTHTMSLSISASETMPLLLKSRARQRLSSWRLSLTRLRKCVSSCANLDVVIWPMFFVLAGLKLPLPGVAPDAAFHRSYGSGVNFSRGPQATYRAWFSSWLGVDTGLPSAECSCKGAQKEGAEGEEADR